MLDRATTDRESTQPVQSQKRGKTRTLRERLRNDLRKPRFLVGVFTLILLAIYTRATQHLVELSQRTLELQQRSWVLFDTFSVAEDLSTDEIISARIVLKNSGAGPALKVHARIEVKDESAPFTGCVKNADVPGKPSLSDLGHQQTVSYRVGIRPGTLMIVMGAVAYQDQFEKHRLTMFCRSVFAEAKRPYKLEYSACVDCNETH